MAVARFEGRTPRDASRDREDLGTEWGAFARLRGDAWIAAAEAWAAEVRGLRAAHRFTQACAAERAWRLSGLSNVTTVAEPAVAAMKIAARAGRGGAPFAPLARRRTPGGERPVERLRDLYADIRTALVYLPASHERVASLPVVIDLHASGITPEIQAQVTGMVDAANSLGFLVALPEARTPFPSGGTTWNVPDRGDGDNEVAFLEALLDRLETSFCIDRDRVFATGFSGGARLASHLACRVPAQFSAIGVVGGLRAPARDSENCAISDPGVRVLAFHSEDDPVNPFHGETDAAPAYWSHGVDDAFSWWARRLGCDSIEKNEIGTRITQISASQCAEGAALSLYVLAETGHTWPGSAFPFPEGLGATERELDATAIILDWFGLVPATEREDASRDADG